MSLKQNKDYPKFLSTHQIYSELSIVTDQLGSDIKFGSFG